MTIAVTLAASGLALAPAAQASAGQVSIIQDSTRMLTDPAGTMSTFRALGVRMVRIIVVWAQIAPAAESRQAPHGFNAADPASYPAANWAPYDEMIQLAHADGLGVDLTLSGGAPRWAEGPGIPPAALDNQFWAWRPSAQAFGQFARAVAARYSGTYVPPGQTTPLPRVSFWAIWNEPNFGEDLGPQAVNGSTVSVAPGMYRALAGQMWNALQATGHGHDTILIGEFAPLGLSGRAGPGHPQGLPGNFGQTKPLAVPAHAVLRRLELPGAARTARPGRSAARRPPAGSRSFRAPESGAVQGDAASPTTRIGPTSPRRPRPRRIPTSRRSRGSPTSSTRSTVSSESTARASASRSTTPSTATSPIPRIAQDFASPATAAYYINWAEYLSWKQPRIASTMQYLLYDPVLNGAVPGDGGFTSGLLFVNGKPKPGYAAYRLPLFLPVTQARREPLARGVGMRAAGALRDPRRAASPRRRRSSLPGAAPERSRRSGR